LGKGGKERGKYFLRKGNYPAAIVGQNPDVGTIFSNVLFPQYATEIRWSGVAKTVILSGISPIRKRASL
jgi:hypothetical protein